MTADLVRIRLVVLQSQFHGHHHGKPRSSKTIKDSEEIQLVCDLPRFAEKLVHVIINNTVKAHLEMVWQLLSKRKEWNL